MLISLFLLVFHLFFVSNKKNPHRRVVCSCQGTDCTVAPRAWRDGKREGKIEFRDRGALRFSIFVS